MQTDAQPQQPHKQYAYRRVPDKLVHPIFARAMQQQRAVDAIKMLNNHPLVERYAWYPWNTYNHLYENDVMTNLGKAFTAAPQYRQ